jgi:nitrous oxidase accessory protein NosD
MRHTFRRGLVLAAGLVMAAGFWVSPAGADGRNPIGKGGGPLGTVIEVPPGSDTLQAAVNGAPAGATLILKAGLHAESGTVLIDHTLSLVGEPGAVLESVTTEATTQSQLVEPALHVRGASGTRIVNLEIRPPAGSKGNTGIAIENSGDVLIAANHIHDVADGVIVQNGDGAVILGNAIEVDPDYVFGSVGVTIVNGRGTRVSANRISGGLFGVFACDRDGVANGNTFTANTIGLIVCRVPQASFVLSGIPIGAATSGTDWSVHDNVATGNGWGYLVIDGGNGARLSNNEASNNSFYDIELAGDSYRFGFLTPTSFDNFVSTGGRKDLVVKDCGLNNKVTGAATQVDTGLDPCF